MINADGSTAWHTNRQDQLDTQSASRDGPVVTGSSRRRGRTLEHGDERRRGKRSLRSAGELRAAATWTTVVQERRPDATPPAKRAALYADATR